MSVSDASDAVRQLVSLAGELLRERPGQSLPIPPSELALRLNRVARLRNELHVTANRVADFSYEEHPHLDAVRITAPTASSAALVATRVLVQLDLTAARLIKHLDTLSAADWKRTGRAGDEIVALGELVEDVVRRGNHDLLDLKHAAPAQPQPPRERKMPSRREISVRRIYDDDDDSSYRVLVDRLWPRGISKVEAALDEWLQDVAPTTALRRWYGHDVSRFQEFARHYRSELRRAPGSNAVKRLNGLAEARQVTLLTATRDVEHSAARVLQQHLTTRVPATTPTSSGRI